MSPKLQLHAESNGTTVWIHEFDMPKQSHCVHDEVVKFRAELDRRCIVRDKITLHTEESDGWLRRGVDWAEVP